LLNNKKISVTKVDKLVESLLVTGFSYDRAIIEENNYKEYCQLSNLTHGVRRSGSAAFDLASVAAGRIDGFWETGLSIWDVSAGSIIVREAGGKVTGIDGNEISMKDVGIIATNSKIHDELSDEIRFIKSCVNF
jgi:myo-inositol-1(or 4)-monophosphatase